MITGERIGPVVSFRARIAPGAVAERLAPFVERLQNLRPAMAPCVAVMRDRVREEFDGKQWFAPSGSTVGWAPLVPFGQRSPERPPLIGTGAYAAAWQGVGTGAITQIRPDGATIGVSGSVFPFAAALRGGAGPDPSTAPTLIRPKKRSAGKRGGWAMFWFLGLELGVWLSQATLARGLRLPGRPHATPHPELRRRLAATIRRYVLAGVAEPSLS